MLKSIAFNTAASFASISMNQFEFPTTRGVPAMRIGGNVYHNIGCIYPEGSKQNMFMQCLFHTDEMRDDLISYGFVILKLVNPNL